MSTQVAPTPTPSGEHSEAPYLVASSEDALETEKLKRALEQFYETYDKQKLKQGVDNIVDWTRRHGVDALNDRLNQKYGKDLRSPKEPPADGKIEPEFTGEDAELVETLKQFFTKHTPEKVDRNYADIVKFVGRKGLKALNRKLQDKYGETLNTFEEEDDSESLPSILGGMPVVVAGTNSNGRVLSVRSGINPLDEKSDDVKRLNLYERVSTFYKQFGKERLTKGVGNIVDWTLEHGEEALNKKLRKKYNKDLTDITVTSQIQESAEEEEEEEEESKMEEGETKAAELEKLPEPKKDSDEDSEKRFSKDGRLSQKSGLNPFNNEQDSVARLELQERLTKFYGYFRMDKLKKGIGSIVDWAMENGEEALNEQLRDKYDYDLDTFEEKIKESEKEDLKERETEELKLEVESELLGMRERLIKFFNKHDPERAHKSLDILIKYIELKGFKSLNEKLFAKYGADINSFEEAQEKETDAERAAREQALRRRSLKFVLPTWVYGALELYYVKYNQAYIENGGVETIYEWAQRNGLAALNESLKSQYNEDLEEFLEATNVLREELRGFYKIADESKDDKNIEQVLNWGVKNGRDALNKMLRKKYRFDLDIAKEEYDEFQSDDENIF